MKITKEKLLRDKYSMKHEWIITNGIGGYAASTLCGLNTRKYHAYLVAALGPSRERRVILSKVNESVEIRGNVYPISTNECPNYLEDGYLRQEQFEKNPLPEWEYKVQDALVKKKISLVYGENAVCILYNIKTAENRVKFTLAPLFNNRDFHKVNSNVSFVQAYSESAVKIDLDDNIKAYMNCDGTYIEYENTFYKNMIYNLEKERGLEYIENHYIPGAYEINVPPNSEKEVRFVLSVDEMKSKENILKYIRQEEVRLEKICKVAGAKNEIERQLAIAADNFIIKKSGGTTVIAGYPWFSDWGRDTFIAFEGILLKTNRLMDAKNILLHFSKYIKNGLIPNVISENGGESYNSVDSSLWYIEAVYQYMHHTNDVEFLRGIYSTVREIVDSYIKGTDNNIKMDDDGLITAGDEHTQLTWMDAKVGDIVPTPRYGKAVEINALWYNALKIMETFSDVLNIEFDKSISSKVKKSFKKFYNDVGLFDTIEPNNSQIRPNQIMAVGLSHNVISGEKALEVLEVVKEKLLTDKGLKTLDANDEKYIAMYEGDVYHRDIAYHQGTVWPWLFKVYAKAIKNMKGESFKIEKLEELLSDCCLGNISEIYDADDYRSAKGAFAQAWSVAAAIETL